MTRGAAHRTLAAALTATSLIVVAGCSDDTPTTAPSSSHTFSSSSRTTTPSAFPTTSVAPEVPRRVTAEAGLPSEAELKAAKNDVAKLTTEQLAGQVIVGYYSGDQAGDAAAAITKDGLGGVIVMGDNVPGDVKQGMPVLTEAAQQAMQKTGRSWPAVIGIDQEGGPVARVGAPLTQLPGGMAYGASDDEKLAETITKGQGEELRALGVTMVFAPDADVTVGPQDPTIGVRSPSSDPRRVASVVNAQVKGFQEAGLVPVIKHFPGHGSVTTDTHVDYAIQSQSVDVLMQRDWIPFASAAKAGAPAVMTAHIVLKDVDPGVPATLSPKALTDELRDKLGFKGLIVTDGMNMGAIVKKFDRGGAAAVSALKAGADIVLMPANASASVAAIVRAVDRGELTRERLLESAARIVATARHHQVKTPPLSAVGSHGADAVKLARASITQIGGTCGRRMLTKSFRLDGGSRSDRAVLTKALQRQGLAVSGNGTRISLISGGTYNAGKASAKHGSEAKKPGGADAATSTSAGIQVALDTPYPLAKLPRGAVGLATYGRTAPTFTALAEVLTGAAKPSGVLPVAVGTHRIGTSACS